MRKLGPPIATVCLLFSLAGCTTDNFSGMGSGQKWGTLGGAALGGLVGSQFGSGGGKVAAGLGGALLGGIAGNLIGARFDERDRAQHAQAVSNSLATTRPKRWVNPDTGNSGTIVPLRSYTKPATGQRCREYEDTYNRDGKTTSQISRICLSPDGTWVAS
jgi:surface antigen